MPVTTWHTGTRTHALQSAPVQDEGVVSMAMRKWLWPNCREVILPGVSRGVMIIMFVIMLGVRS